MKFNKRLGIYLAAPVALMAVSVTNANADTVSQDQGMPSVQAMSQQTVAVSTAVNEESADAEQSVASTTPNSAVASELASTSSVTTSGAVASESPAASSTSRQTVVANTDKNNDLVAAPANSESVSVSTQTFSPRAFQAPASYAQLFTSLYTANNYTQQQINNATYIHDYFINQGWTSNAIAGMLGNFVSESGLNPDLHQYGGGPGYGLAQWTASAVQGWCNSNGYDYRTLQGQCAYIQYQMTHGQQYYPSRYSRMTANEYMHSYESAYNLGMIWLNNFERPANRNQPARGQQAQYWFQYFQNHGGPTAPIEQPSQPATSGNGDVMQQRGTFRVAYGLNVRQAPSTSAAIVAKYSGGQSFTYDSKVVSNGYLWVSYMSYSGARRYVAIKNLSTGQTFGTDSNNFSFTGMSTNTPSTTPQNPASQGSKAEQIISLARQQLGKPYVYGATGPNSFDCSGLVQYVYRQAGVNLPRTAAQQSNQGYSVSMNNLQPGDLLFWGNPGSAYHVGIYTGNGKTLFAPQPGQTVKEQPMSYWMPNFARRVL